MKLDLDKRYKLINGAMIELPEDVDLRSLYSMIEPKSLYRNKEGDEISVLEWDTLFSSPSYRDVYITKIDGTNICLHTQWMGIPNFELFESWDKFFETCLICTKREKILQIFHHKNLHEAQIFHQKFLKALEEITYDNNR